MLRCGPGAAYRLMSSGEIESALIAGKWTTSHAAVEEYVQRKILEGTPSHRQRRRRRLCGVSSASAL